MGPLWNVVRVVVRVVMRLVGWVVGFAEGGFFGGNGSGRRGNGVLQRQPASVDARIPRPTWGPDLSLMDDEYL